MANAGCINAYDCNGCLIQTLQNLDSACIGVGVQYTAPNPLDDKRLDYIKYTDKCGCVQCLSAENEILIYATDGVIKNLTLTNDDVNEAIKIQWNDIFGSNRAKTIVRYKTGSYPVSITDGTLAVEETTKNQYSSTPFSLSGVLDETTYYISAFAVDSNDTIINVQGMSITTSFFFGKYQRVEYITSDRYQRIDTGYKGNYNTAFEMKVRMTSAYSGSSTQMWPGGDMGSQSDYNSIQFVFGTTSSTNVNNRFGGSIVALNGNNTSVNVDYTVYTDKNKFTLNGTQMTRTGSVGTFPSTDNNLRLLQVANKYGEEGFVGRTYYAKIRDNGTLIRDFVPAYRKSDGVIGMVEKVSKTFYTNKGSGTFGKGSDIPR